MPVFTERDREASRATHRLFRSAWLQDKPNFIIWIFTRPPALLIYNVFIPFQVAYGLQAIITRNFNQVPHYAFTVLMLALAYCTLWAIGGVAIVKNAKTGILYIHRKVFSNYLEKDYEFLNNTYLGTLSNQAMRLKESLDEYDQILFNGFTKQLIIVVSSITIIAYQSPLLAIITLASMIIILGFTIAITRWRIKYRRLLSEANSQTAGVVGDAISHATTVKSFAAENYEKARLNRSLVKLADTQYWSWMTSIPADVGRMLLAAIATVLLLITTAELYEKRLISIAIVILVQLYVIKLIAATQEIADLIKSYEATMSSAHQAVKTMLVQPTIVDKASTLKLARNSSLNVNFQNVTYRYPDMPRTLTAVKNFSLQLRPGEKVGLVGYSGSGKTTLTRLLLRFMDINSGSIQIDGIDIRDLKQSDLRHCIAYVPQDPLLFHRSIFENISYGRPTAKKIEILNAAKAAYVDEFVKELPLGYETVVGERGIKLSGGQRQRVAIARALLKDAPILVLDEATSALDSRSEKLIQEALWRLIKGRTALVIAHRLSTIQRMDRIVVMHKGKIVQIGTHEELLKDAKGIYAELWGHQSGGYIGIDTK
jgi:ATP-binding cassette, subfamily B, bacterial